MSADGSKLLSLGQEHYDAARDSACRRDPVSAALRYANHEKHGGAGYRLEVQYEDGEDAAGPVAAEGDDWFALVVEGPGPRIRDRAEQLVFYSKRNVRRAQVIW